MPVEMLASSHRAPPNPLLPPAMSRTAALLALHNAKEGGLSSWTSSVSVHNEIVRRRPELAEVLAGPWFFDRKGEVPEGKKPFFEIPGGLRHLLAESCLLAWLAWHGMEQGGKGGPCGGNSRDGGWEHQHKCPARRHQRTAAHMFAAPRPCLRPASFTPMSMGGAVLR